MAKELVKKDIPAISGSIEVVIEDSKVKASAVCDLAALVDKAAVAVPGDSMIEQLAVSLIKQGLAAL
jgi:hypothetical protein